MLQLSDIETVVTDPRPTYLRIDEIARYVHPMLAELVKQIRDELVDVEHKDRRHGMAATHNAGCGGPLCRRGRRIWRHQNYATKRHIKGKSYNPRTTADFILSEPLFILFQEMADRDYEIKKLEAKTRREVEKALKRAETSVNSAEVPEAIDGCESADNSRFIINTSALGLVMLL